MNFIKKRKRKKKKEKIGKSKQNEVNIKVPYNIMVQWNVEKNVNTRMMAFVAEYVKVK